MSRSSQASPLLVGLTGGMASGKSTVARLLAGAGCEVIDADRVVAELYLPGAPGARAIADLGGPRFLTREGGVDHAALAERVFADDDFRRAVETAIHPLVLTAFEKRARETSRDILVLEATLLVEAGYRAALDTIVTVEASPEAQLERAIARGLDEERARARLRAQGDGATRRAGADRTIVNDGSLDDLERTVEELYADLLLALEERALEEHEEEA